jgi:hypothetical protein
MRNLGGSVGISILEARLTENIQPVHSQLIEQSRPDNPFSQAPQLKAPLSLTDPAGIAALKAEVTEQASIRKLIVDVIAELAARHLQFDEGPRDETEVRAVSMACRTTVVSDR